MGVSSALSAEAIGAIVRVAADAKDPQHLWEKVGLAARAMNLELELMEEIEDAARLSPENQKNEWLAHLLDRARVSGRVEFGTFHSFQAD